MIAFVPSRDIPLISGLSDLQDHFDAFLLDLWGVVHDGNALYSDVLECLVSLRRAEKKVVFLSNSPNRATGAAHKLARMGVGSDLYDGIVTAGEVAHLLLQENSDPDIRALGSRICDIDGVNASNILDGLSGRTRVHTPEDADVLLATVVCAPVGHPLDLYDSFLERGLARNLPLLCANPDRVVLVGQDMYYCPGAVADRYEAMGGRSLRVGKPYPHVYDRARHLLSSISPQRIAAVGDALHTDISGAYGAGITGILNLTGIHWHEIRSPAHPHRHDPDKLHACLSAHPHSPNYLIQGLRW